MTEQKVILEEGTTVVNDYLSKGWTVVSITAQYVASGENHYPIKGGFLYVIERTK